MRVADWESVAWSRRTQALALGPGGTVRMKGTLRIERLGEMEEERLPAGRLATIMPPWRVTVDPKTEARTIASGPSH